MGIIETVKNKTYPLTYRVIDKCLSARFIVTIIIASTLSYAVVRSFDMIYLILTKQSGLDKDTVVFVKEVFLYVMGVFSGIIGTVFASYFSRQDRMKEKSNGDLNKE